jgi:hypothetical protein
MYCWLTYILQDMHYAEFAEDEVSNFVRLTAVHTFGTATLTK